MKTIYKYEIGFNDGVNLCTYTGIKPLSVNIQDGKVCMWAMIDTNEYPAIIKIHIIGTGQPIPLNSTYIDTIMDGQFVWHFFYEKKDAIRTAPFQRENYKIVYPSTRITWEAHLEAYKSYSRRYGTSQSAERIAERGGFGEEELDDFYPDWRNHIVR